MSGPDAAAVPITKAIDDAAFDVVASLMIEYADWLPFELCIQDFDEELSQLRSMYGPPRGAAFVARLADDPVGVVGIRELGDDIAELKRMWVRSRGRGRGIGKLLAATSAQGAGALGYRAIRLDTVAPAMAAAIVVYESLGYRDIDAYRHNPLPGARFLELDLARLSPPVQ